MRSFSKFPGTIGSKASALSHAFPAERYLYGTTTAFHILIRGLKVKRTKLRTASFLFLALLIRQNYLHRFNASIKRVTGTEVREPDMIRTCVRKTIEHDLADDLQFLAFLIDRLCGNRIETVPPDY
ncbi:MAG: hypothetical protein ACO1N5_16280 [Noviherbaspirillum sp.]